MSWLRWRREPLPLSVPPDPDCHQVGSVLQAYLDGELGPQHAEIVAHHLQHCHRCGIEATTITNVVAAIKRQRPDLDPEPLERLTQFVDQLPTDERRSTS